MWAQMEESGDCCGFIVPEWSEQSWRVVRHGSSQLNKDKMQMKETDPAAHLHSDVHLCASRATGRSARSEAAAELFFFLLPTMHRETDPTEPGYVSIESPIFA